MWYVFPQLAGLGTSAMSQRYAISGLDEARLYLAHPLLGPRLAACAKAVLAHTGTSARVVMGTPDDLKLRSSATLFARVSPSGSVFHRGWTILRWDDGSIDRAPRRRRDAPLVRRAGRCPQLPAACARPQIAASGRRRKIRERAVTSSPTGRTIFLYAAHRAGQPERGRRRALGHR